MNIVKSVEEKIYRIFSLNILYVKKHVKKNLCETRRHDQLWQLKKKSTVYEVKNYGYVAFYPFFTKIYTIHLIIFATA